MQRILFQSPPPAPILHRTKRPMAIEFKDYYETLGIDREADQADVRRAFRRLARKYHPDVAQHDPKAEERFKEINEANAVLGDPDKRRKYDKLGADWDEHEPFQPFSNMGEDFEFHFAGTGFSDFFEKFFAAEERGEKRDSEDSSDPNRRRRSKRPETPRATQPGEQSSSPSPDSGLQNNDVEANLMVTIEEAIHGAARPITVRLKLPCNACQGDGGRCLVCKGEGHVTKSVHHQVRIPPGVKEGQRLRLRGKGYKGPHGGPAGDLYLNVKLAGDPDLRMDEGELIHDLNISPQEAVLGTEIEIASPRGRVRIKIPSGIQSEARLRLPGHGVVNEHGEHGDLTIVAHVRIPTRMTKEEYALWKELAKKSHFNPREE